MIEWFKKHWGLKNTWHVVLVMFIFSITGITFLHVKPPLFDLLGLTPDRPRWVRIGATIAVGPPLYYVLLMVWGTLLGQFRFFWEFEKRTLRRLNGKRRQRPAPNAGPSCP